MNALRCSDCPVLDDIDEEITDEEMELLVNMDFDDFENNKLEGWLKKPRASEAPHKIKTILLETFPVPEPSKVGWKRNFVLIIGCLLWLFLFINKVTSCMRANIYFLSGEIELKFWN